MVKIAKVGVYESKTRGLQRKLSYEATSMTWKIAKLYRYLGSRSNVDPQLSDIQTTTFMETPDRAYASESVSVNIYFEPLPEQVTDYSQFGIIDPIGGAQVIKMHINSFEDIGREVTEGDVLEIPFFETDGKRAYWEVNDVDRSQMQEKFYVTLKTDILKDARETREIDINNSTGTSLDDIMAQHGEEAEEFVPHNGVDDSVIDNGETNKDMADSYKGVSDDRKSFLDDFDGGLL